MKYLLDRNILSKKHIENVQRKSELCVTNDVAEESGLTKQEIARIQGEGVLILKPSGMHFEKLKEVMATHGANTRLINLYSGQGTADVVMIAYILAEQEADKSLFPEKYIIVTKDAELTSVATSYGITCVSEID